MDDASLAMPAGAARDMDAPLMPVDVYPPANFNLVVSGVYRSSFPKKKNFGFLKKLGLRSILCVFAPCLLVPRLLLCIRRSLCVRDRGNA
jgi:hypothetical protein